MVKYYNLPETYYEQGFGEYMNSVCPPRLGAGKPKSFWKRLADTWNDFLDYRPGKFNGNEWSVGGY